MFGIGFTELLLISVIAILFLGPDKLPETMVQIAKFMKSVKKTINDAKSSLDEEMRIADLKEEALNYKKQLDSATSELRSFKNVDFDELMGDVQVNTPKKQPSPYAEDKPAEEAAPAVQVEPKNETVTFEKKSRKKKTSQRSEKETENEKAAVNDKTEAPAETKGEI